MQLDQQAKLSVLLAALGERYTSIHNIRTRVENVGLWSLGLLLGLGGWLMQSKAVLDCQQRALYAAGVIAAVFLVRVFYLADLQAGFQGQQRAAARVEAILGLYKASEFDASHEPVFPKSWENAGTQKGGGRFFRTTYYLLYAGTAFVLISILVSGHTIPL